MENVGELRDEVGRLRDLVDAGHRGRPIGGEVLAAFGGIVGLTALLHWAAAFRVLPFEFAMSPLTAAGAFLAFVMVVTGRERAGSGGFRRAVLLSMLAGLVMEAIWRGALAWVQATERAGGAEFQPVIPLALFGLVVGCFGAATLLGLARLRRQFAPLSPVNRAILSGWSGVTVALFVLVAMAVLSGVRTNMWFALMLLPALFWLLWGIGWWISGWASHSRWMLWVALGSWLLAMTQAYTFEFYLGSAVGLVALALLPGLQLMREARVAAR